MGIFKNIFGNLEETNAPQSNVNWRTFTNTEQLDEIIELSFEKPVLIFKHSTRCGISRMVLKNFENDYNPDNDIVAFFLDLLAYREVSNTISEKFNVMHQSPQLLLIRNGKSIYDASHSNIDAQLLESKL